MGSSLIGSNQYLKFATTTLIPTGLGEQPEQVAVQPATVVPGEPGREHPSNWFDAWLAS
jgi:hypothetical protein